MAVIPVPTSTVLHVAKSRFVSRYQCQDGSGNGRVGTSFLQRKSSPSKRPRTLVARTMVTELPLPSTVKTTVRTIREFPVCHKDLILFSSPPPHEHNPTYTAPIPINITTRTFLVMLIDNGKTIRTGKNAKVKSARQLTAEAKKVTFTTTSGGKQRPSERGLSSHHASTG